MCAWILLQCIQLKSHRLSCLAANSKKKYIRLSMVVTRCHCITCESENQSEYQQRGNSLLSVSIWSWEKWSFNSSAKGFRFGCPAPWSFAFILIRYYARYKQKSGIVAKSWQKLTYRWSSTLHLLNRNTSQESASCSFLYNIVYSHERPERTQIFANVNTEVICLWHNMSANWLCDLFTKSGKSS